MYQMATLDLLLTPGIIGNYTHFEATEVFATEDASRRVSNVFTILVAESRNGWVPEPARFLNKDRIKLKSLPLWTFGVMRYIRPIASLQPSLASMVETGNWCGSGKSLHVGKLHEVPPQFVPPDTATAVAWNKVLKNNFWNGSHVFEWSDNDKAVLKPFFEDSRRLQELSRKVMECVPIALAALSDRLGNVAVQLPVTVFMHQFSKAVANEALVFDIAWHPEATPRSLRASCELEFDGILTGYAEAALLTEQISLLVDPGLGVHRGFIWDDLNQVLMAATGPGSFVGAVQINMAVGGSEPRTFSVAEPGGTRRTYTIGLTTGSSHTVGEQHPDSTGGYTRRRMYSDQMERLAAERVFIQYKPTPDQQDAEHERALGDLRSLLALHGRNAVWLWDPFLSARDIWETLFHCPHFGSDLRALTAAKEPPDEAVPFGLWQWVRRWFSKPERRRARRQHWIQRQREELNSIESNWQGFRLEYRVKTGPAGFGFHDRFLIFPRTEEDALVWSLGTSINSIGTEHHILQRVDNGQLIRDAFLELWEQLDKPEHLIWKRP